MNPLKSDTKVIGNGLKIITSNMNYMESVAIGVWVAAGGRYENKETSGISHFTEHMLFKGTKTRDAKGLKQAIEGIGGQFNGFTAEEVTCYLVRVPSVHTELGIDILADMVMNPRMDANEIEKERQVIIEEIKMYKDQPSSYVHEILTEIMWPDHPLGMALTGYEDTVNAIDRKALCGFIDEYYQPSNIVLVACGKIDEEGFDKMAAQRFHKKGKNEDRKYKKFTKTQSKKKSKIFYKDTEQTQVALGFHSFGRKDKRRHTLNMLNVIFGANMSSRLFDELREKRGLCYDVSSFVKKYEETGGIFLHAGVDNKKVKETTEAMMEQIALIRSELVTDDELKRAKDYYSGQLLLALEETSSRMLWLGDKVVTENRIPDVNEILAEIKTVNKEDIRSVAKEVFREENLNIAAIGPENSLSRVDFDDLTKMV